MRGLMRILRLKSLALKISDLDGFRILMILRAWTGLNTTTEGVGHPQRRPTSLISLTGWQMLILEP